MKPLLLDPKRKLTGHIKLIFDTEVRDELPEIQCEFSKKTGRIKNFSIDSKLFATLRKDGHLALTIFGAEKMVEYKEFKQNCVIPKEEAIPFIIKGKSLFCKHVEWCGNNINIGSEVVVIDRDKKVLAVGKSICSHLFMNKLQHGVAIKIREGIKSRNSPDK